MALLYGTVKSLLQKEETPKVIVTSHFFDAVQALRDINSNNLEFLTMDFMV